MATIAPRRESRLSALPMHQGWPAHRRRRWSREIEREIVEETTFAHPGPRYPPAAHYTSVDANEAHELPDTAAPQCDVGAGNQEARRTWKTMSSAFTDAWREALAAWTNGARACIQRCGWLRAGLSAEGVAGEADRGRRERFELASRRGGEAPVRLAGVGIGEWIDDQRR